MRALGKIDRYRNSGYNVGRREIMGYPARRQEREHMGKCWAAGALLAFSLMWVMLLSPLAWASGRMPGDTAGESLTEERPPAAEIRGDGDDLVLVEIVEFAGSLEAMRAVMAEDVPAEDRDVACWALYRELLSPGENGNFDGEEPVSRAEAIQALYQLSGILVRVDACSYPDVPEEYQDAVAWADSVGVSGGISEGRFAPFIPVTRGQLAAMLHRFAAWRGEDRASRLALSWDDEEVSSYAEEALNWVLDRGLYEGMTCWGAYPQLPVSRLQLAGILARLQKDRDPLAAEITLQSGEPVSRSRQNHEELAAVIQAASRRYGAVGVQVAVIEEGSVTDAYHCGWAEKRAVPMTDQHKMRTASLSKVAVGLSAALLREEGMVDYNADIGEYWGKNARNPRHPDTPVTIASILTHTSTLLNSENIAWDYEGVRAQLGSAAGYGGGTPGKLKNWSYNNHAFGILGQTLELASGRFLDDILEERLLRPLGADCAFAAGELEQTELITPIYRTASLGRSASSLRSVHRWSAPGATGRQFAGGFTSSALDMAKLTAVLAGDGCFEGVRLMEAESVKLMESHSASAIPEGSYQAMPMRYRSDIYGRQGLYYHTGSAYGAYNLLSYDPSTGDGVVVLTMGANGFKDNYAIYAVCGEISKAVYDAIK